MSGRDELQEDGRAMTAIREQDMRALLDRGQAEPLLPDTYPVPARYDGLWWHQPAGTADRPPANVDTEGGPSFVPAPAEQAARYDDLHRRHRQAHAGPPGAPPDE